MDTIKCSQCGKPAQGYKCDTCGMEMPTPDASHVCGVEHILPKCSGCALVQTACTCVA